MPQRLVSRGSHPLRTSSSDSDPLHHRSITDRSLKLGDRRSPRGSHPDSLNQKKLGTRIADLESQLGQAQEELKILKDQLASAEAAKKEAQKELEKKANKPTFVEREEIQEKHPPQHIQEVRKVDSNVADDVSDDNQQEADVFEVQVEKESVEAKVEIDQVDGDKCTSQIVTEPVANSEAEKLLFNDLALKDEEISKIKGQLEEKENKLQVFVKENQDLKNLLYEATSKISSARVKEEENSIRLSKLGEELEESQANAAQLKSELEKLEAAERAKEILEAEIKKMRVQTEQWRKAADAAAAVLAGAVEMNGRITERCGSMDKHFGGVFETPDVRYSTAFAGSPGMADDLDDSFGNAKRKGSGIKKLGDLWRKKGQK
ncbi:interactor of constitutive active ROPs 4 isoform X2 [Ricinus communis]|nr:interactor of constitutive active ROPs 4 isoform X2 [Ricinus communis]